MLDCKSLLLCGTIFLLHQLVPTHTQVQNVRWWMHHFKSLTPKRHYAYSNSKPIHRLDKGVLQGWKAKKKEGNGVVTATRYIDANGKKRYKGTTSLKSTEPLDCSNAVQVFRYLFLLTWDLCKISWWLVAIKSLLLLT